MTDIKLTKKNPIESAVNKLKESANNEIQKKISEKVKAALDAQRIFNTLKGEIQDLLKEQEVEKIEVNSLLEELK